MLCMGFVQNFAGLLICRLMLGVTEAVSFELLSPLLAGR